MKDPADSFAIGCSLYMFVLGVGIVIGHMLAGAW